MKFLIGTLSIIMGINLWLTPQISEHCPNIIPGRLILNLPWLIRPGVASILIPNDGIVHECNTSAADTRIRICVFMGKIIRLSTSNNRNSLLLFNGFIYESNSKLLKSEYSYLQYHWCPIALTVNIGLLISSIRYNKWRDGRAINIKITAGSDVQMNSTICSSKSNRLIIELFIIVNIIYITVVVIIIKIIIVWSWKKINCSIIGELASCVLILAHVDISNKRYFFIYEA